uniref:Uncharacterized protein n=1 Tax=Branchiostoma floridae TaxID=7739 RepID=C3XTA1_BRAFL|eukprot:XP_002612681.1 hypothetical protein BRAFLDRAFT_106694 [Branchiostoma floridae]
MVVIIMGDFWTGGELDKHPHWRLLMGCVMRGINQQHDTGIPLLTPAPVLMGKDLNLAALEFLEADLGSVEVIRQRWKVLNPDTGGYRASLVEHNRTDRQTSGTLTQHSHGPTSPDSTHDVLTPPSPVSAGYIGRYQPAFRTLACSSAGGLSWEGDSGACGIR